MSVCADGTRGFDARGGAAAPPESYPERALAAFERRLGAMCRRESARADADERVRLGRFFRDHLGWRWPYSGDPNASAAPRSTLIEFLHRAESVEAGPPGSELEAVVRPWGRNRDGDPVLELGVEWRTAPERERNAEHLADYRLEGLAELGHGVREWRYGDPPPRAAPTREGLPVQVRRRGSGGANPDRRGELGRASLRPVRPRPLS